MKIFKFNEFINEAIVNEKDLYNTSFACLVSYTVDPFDKNSIILKPENKKKILSDVEKNIVDIIKKTFANNDALKIADVISKNDNESTILVKSNGNLAHYDEDGKICEDLLKQIDNYANKNTSIDAIGVGIVSFATNEKKEEIAVAYDKESKQWKEMTGFESKDRSMKF